MPQDTVKQMLVFACDCPDDPKDGNKWPKYVGHYCYLLIKDQLH